MVMPKTERLTYDFCIGGNHCWQIKGADNYLCKDVCVKQGDSGCEICPIKKAFDRLAAYEDTMHLERAQELAQAEKDGRLVVLPCKVGDFVYALWDVTTEYKYVIYCAEIKEICISVRNCRLTITYRLEPIEYRGRRKEYRTEDFGKTVFLTREEAEAALKKREET